MFTDPIRALAHPTPLSEVTLYSAAMVIPVTGPIIPEGAVAVSNRRVVHVGTRQWVLDILKDEMSNDSYRKMFNNERHWHGLMTPGLINAHTHLQYTNMASVGRGEYRNFRDWEEGFNVVYDKLQEEKQHNPSLMTWKTSAYEGARMMVEAGTTAAADIVTDIEAVGALASQGMHGIAYWEVMGWKNVDWKEEGYAKLLEMLGHMMDNGRVPSIGISPHAPYSLETEPFVDLPDIARQLNMRLHIHLAETPMEAGNHADTLTTYSA
ncbi:cytosine deaminase, partial [Gardnerella vaginalis]